MEPGSVRESICSSTLRKGQSNTRCHGSCVGRFSVIPAHESLRSSSVTELELIALLLHPQYPLHYQQSVRVC